MDKLTDTNMQGLLEKAKKNLQEFGNLTQVALIFSSGKLEVIGFGGIQDKTITRTIIASTARKMNADWVAFIAEAWVKQEEREVPEEELRRLEEEGIANDPARTEAIMFVAKIRGGECVVASVPFIKTGNHVVFGEQTVMRSGEIMLMKAIPDWW